ncbi:MAG: RNA polymerase sigma-70 factor [Saprospiraceae bacterium]|nr:RNA polymerase sigma-70 factor [Saprospiraceae bacterium]MBP9195789.1 RNA polymerase sigma-70 factor [Saprospiraceae bacterium]
MDKETFRYLFDTYYNALCNYACLTLGMNDDAEDVVMEVFTHIWDKREGLSELENPKAYLFKSVYHKAMEKIRAKKLVIVALEGEKIVVPDYKEEIADDYLLKEKIFQSIRQLPTQCRVIFVKSKIEGMSHKEIAQEMQIAVKTIENQITKAFKLIRKQLDTI